MKYFALIGLIDEADCIGACIDHHLAIGFDHVVVTDLGSRDGSREMIEARVATGCVTLLTGSQDLASDWQPHMVDTAIALGADYVAHIDPDEFWVPKSGDLRATAALGQADILSVTRFNAAQTVEDVAGGRRIDPESFLRQPVYVERPVINPDAPPLTGLYQGRVGPKVMHRAVRSQLRHGAHGVSGDGLAEQVTPKDLVILHFPLSSLDHFRLKLANASEFVAANPQLPPRTAWHWRRFIAAEAERRLEAEYAAQLLTAPQVETRLAEGRILPLNAVLDDLRDRYHDYSRPRRA